MAESQGTSGLHEASRANTSTSGPTCGPCGGPCNGSCKYKANEGTEAKGGTAVHADFPKAPDPSPLRVGKMG